MFQFSGGAITDVGLRRSSNQDNYLYSDELGLYVVADGMGGHNGGETASRIAVESMRKFYEERASLPPASNAKEEVEILRQAVEFSNRSIFEHAQEHLDLRGMGTTLVVLRIRGETGFVAHVGDSRLYRMDSRTLRRVTKDHSRVQELIDAKQLTEIEAQSILGRNIITRALGNRPHVEVDTQILNLRPEDAFLLCSDGLCGFVGDEDTFRIVTTTQPADPTTILQALLEKVRQAGAPDNVTVLFIKGERFNDASSQAPPLDSFNLYPDTQSLLNPEGDEPEETTKPVVVVSPPMSPPPPAPSPDPDDEPLESKDPTPRKSSPEVLADLQNLVQEVATARTESQQAASAAVDASNDGEEETLKLPLDTVPRAYLEPPRLGPSAPAKPVASVEAPPKPEPLSPSADLQPIEPKRPSVLLMLVGLLALAAILLLFLLFGPGSATFLVANASGDGKSVQVQRVSLPVSAGFGQSLLQGGLGGMLLSLRATDSKILEMPEPVLPLAWNELRNCPDCAVFASSGRLVELGTTTIESFAERLYGSLGDYYRDLSQHELARRFYTKGGEKFNSSELQRLLARDYYIEGLQFEDAKEFSKALENFEKARELGSLETDLESRIKDVRWHIEQIEKAKETPTPVPAAPTARPARPTRTPTPEGGESGDSGGAEKESLGDPFSSESKPTPSATRKPRRTPTPRAEATPLPSPGP